jgi:hypothetical protein
VTGAADRRDLCMNVEELSGRNVGQKVRVEDDGLQETPENVIIGTLLSVSHRRSDDGLITTLRMGFLGGSAVVTVPAPAQAFVVD